MQINLVQSKRFDKYHCLFCSLLWLTFSPLFGAMAYDNYNSLRSMKYSLLQTIANGDLFLCSCVYWCLRSDADWQSPTLILDSVTMCTKRFTRDWLQTLNWCVNDWTVQHLFDDVTNLIHTLNEDICDLIISWNICFATHRLDYWLMFMDEAVLSHIPKETTEVLYLARQFFKSSPMVLCVLFVSLALTTP